MAQRTLPGIGLTGFWDLGYQPWKDENDANLRVLSALVGGQALELVAALPGSPADGDIYLLDETHGTHPNEVAIRDAGVWYYVVPLIGAIMFDLDAGVHRWFDGAAWVELGVGGGGVSLPPVATDADDYTVMAADNGKYIRLTGAATKDIIVQDDATEPLPANGEWHFRNVGAGDATFDPAGGVTINVPIGGSLVVEQGGTVTLKRVATDEFDLIGVTAP